MVNDARCGTQRYEFNFLPEGFGTDFITPLGLPLFAIGTSFLRYPTLTLRNLTALGGNTAIPLQRVENTFQWSDTLTLTFGKHAMKIGGDARRYQLSNFQPQFSSGNYSFTGAFTSTIGSQYATGLADFLLGLPASETILNSTGFDANRLRNTRITLFAQDDWQVSSRLTLNLGLRWERDGAWTEKDDRWGWFDFKTGQVVYPKTAKTQFTTFPYPFRFDDNDDIKTPQNNAFGPRFGFALRPFNNNRTVLRSAYGTFFGQPLGFVALNAGMVGGQPNKLMAVTRIGLATGGFSQPSRFIFSDDNGKTWGNPQLTPLYAHRPIIRILQSGRLLVTYRNSWGTPGSYALAFDPNEMLPYQPTSFIWDEARSTIKDGAMTIRTVTIFVEGEQKLKHSTAGIETRLVRFGNRKTGP